MYQGRPRAPVPLASAAATRLCPRGTRTALRRAHTYRLAKYQPTVYPPEPRLIAILLLSIRQVAFWAQIELDSERTLGRVR